MRSDPGYKKLVQQVQQVRKMMNDMKLTPEVQMKLENLLSKKGNMSPEDIINFLTEIQRRNLDPRLNVSTLVNNLVDKSGGDLNSTYTH